MGFSARQKSRDYVPVSPGGDYALSKEVSLRYDRLWSEFRRDPLVFVSRLEKRLHDNYPLLPRKRYVSRYYNSHSGRWIFLESDEAVLLATLSYEHEIERDRHHNPVRGVVRRVDIVYKREGFFKAREERYWSHVPGGNTRVVFSMLPLSVENLTRLLVRNPKARRDFFETLVAYSSRDYTRKKELEEEHEIVYLLSQLL